MRSGWLAGVYRPRPPAVKTYGNGPRTLLKRIPSPPVSTDTLALWGFIMGAVGTITGVAALGLEFYRERQSRKELAAEEERRKPRVVIRHGLQRHANNMILFQAHVLNDGHVTLHNVTAALEVGVSRKHLQDMQSARPSGSGAVPIGDLMHLDSGQLKPVSLEARQEHEFYVDARYLQGFPAHLDAGWIATLTVKDGGVVIGTVEGARLADSIRSAASAYAKTNPQ